MIKMFKKVQRYNCVVQMSEIINALHENQDIEQSIPVCRICMEGSESIEKGQLISPCKCYCIVSSLYRVIIVSCHHCIVSKK